MWGPHLQIILNTNEWDITHWPYESSNNYTLKCVCSAWECKKEGHFFIVGYYPIFIMQNKFHSPQFHSLSSLFKFTLERPPSNSPLLLNRLGSSQWHHNSHTHLSWSYCSLRYSRTSAAGIKSKMSFMCKFTFLIT